jgi:predicted transcriptional regulator
VGQSDRIDSMARLLGDDCARTILEHTVSNPMTAAELTDACDASRATVYRRLDDLAERDLLAEQSVPDPDGHHRTAYAANLDRLVVNLDEDGFDLTVRKRDRAADRFTSFVEGLYDG